MIKTLLNNKDIVEEYKDDMYRNWVQKNKKQSDIYLCVRDIFESSRKELYVAFINSSKHIFINLEYWISWLSIREVYDIDSPSYNHRWTKDELNSLYIGEYEFIIDLHNLKIAQKKILDYKIDNAVAEKILEGNDWKVDIQPYGDDMVNEDWEPTWEQPYQWCDMPSFNDDDWATFKNRGETIIECSPNNSIENRWLGKYEFGSAPYIYWLPHLLTTILDLPQGAGFCMESYSVLNYYVNSYGN